jgi:hypothetical protein
MAARPASDVTGNLSSASIASASATTVLMVGIACIDTVLTVDDYPAENTKVRAISHRMSRGGNAANSAVVLSQLGHHVAFMASLGSPISSKVGWTRTKYHVYG